jgi:hypothetical protein
MKIERILETKRLLYIKFFFSIEKNCFAVLDKETNKTFLIYLQPENEGPLISYTGGYQMIWIMELPYTEELFCTRWGGVSYWNNKSILN